MKTLALLCFALAVAVSAEQQRHQRIVGGVVTNISKYPYGVAMLYSNSGSGTFVQDCGGTIINNRSVLSAAHCYYYDNAFQFRMRVGSSFAHSGGSVHNVNLVIIHPQYDTRTVDSDLAILRTNVAFSFGANIARANIASSTYNVPNNAAVWAIGWGRTGSNAPTSEQLREVQLFTVDHNTCVNRYREINYLVTPNMLCAGILDVGGRDQCGGDSGSALLHNNAVVGVCSWGHTQCAHPRYPGVNVLVSRFTNWILNNA